MKVLEESFDIGKVLLENMFKSSNLPEKITLPDETLNEYAGTYRDQFGNELIVTEEDGNLKITGGTYSPFLPLFAEEKDKFFLEYFEIKFDFLRNESGDVDQLIHIQEGRVSNRAKKIK